jgi:hypothetical protein
VTNIESTQDVLQEFEQLIASERCSSKHEAELQSFLEANPFLIPNIHSTEHCPESGIIVRKPQLGDFVPDFAFSCVNSQGRTYVLLEIEDPCKKIFTEDDQFDKEFRHAAQQVEDWNGASPELIDRLEPIFSEAKSLPAFYEQHIKTRVRCQLVIGRRKDATSTRKRQERWAAKASSLAASIEIMTYDRLLDRPAPWVKARTYAYRDRKLVPVGG